MNTDRALVIEGQTFPIGRRWKAKIKLISPDGREAGLVSAHTYATEGGARIALEIAMETAVEPLIRDGCTIVKKEGSYNVEQT